jgi:hypothetical protein
MFRKKLAGFFGRFFGRKPRDPSKEDAASDDD